MNRTVNSPALVGLLACLMIIWLLIVTVSLGDFWRTGDEYAFLSLAHGLNLEARLRDGVFFADSGLDLHPGIPFYLVSWFCLRIVALLTAHRDAVAYVLAEPNNFFLASRIAAGLIGLAAVCGAWAVLAPLPGWRRALAIFSFFAADPFSLFYGLSFLTNETFAFPVAVIFFASVKKTISAKEKDWLPWMAVGAAAALGYLVKLTYLSILAGALALAVIQAWRSTGRTTARFMLLGRLVLAILGTFLVVSGGILLIVLGRAQIGMLLTGHIGYVSQTGILGGGPGHSFSLQGFHDALSALSLPNQMTPVPLMVAAAVGSMAAFVWIEWRAGRLDDPKLLWCPPAIVSLGFAILAVMSHYQLYYVPAVAALLPFVWKPMMHRPGFARFAAVCIAVASLITARTTVIELMRARDFAAEVKLDEAEIGAMPLGADEARLWTYKVPSEYFAREFALQLGGLQAYVHERERKVSNEYSTYANVPRPYRYVVFDRRYHRDIATLRQQARDNQLIQAFGRTVDIEEDAVYRLLRQTIVVENPQGGSKQ
jgi:hypothetical protein